MTSQTLAGNTLPNGQIVHQPPGLYSPPVQDLEGSALEAASKTTIDSNAKLAEAARSLGAGQKGARRRKTKRRVRKGGANLNAKIPDLPEAGTIRGVSHAQNHLDAVNNLNQLKYDSVGDADIHAQPIQLGGKGKKRSRKAKKHGRRSNRTHRGRNSKSSHRRRRGGSSMV